MKEANMTEESLVKKEQSEEQTAGCSVCWMPGVDFYENDDEVLLIADLPGVEPSNLAVHLEGSELRIEGRRIQGTNGSKHEALYHRSFRLGEGFDRDKIAAELKNGVLFLHLARSEQVKPRQIKINVA